MNGAREPQASESNTMTERDDEARDSDDAIWKDAETLSPADTRDAKVHLTLRLDPLLYRAILDEKRARRDRTITATVERLLSDGLKVESRSMNSEILRNLRNIIAHGVAQDAILVLLSRNMKLHAEEKQLFETFQAHFADAFKKWLAAEHFEKEGASEPSPRDDLIEAVFNPDSLKPAS